MHHHLVESETIGEEFYEISTKLNQAIDNLSRNDQAACSYILGRLYQSCLASSIKYKTIPSIQPVKGDQVFVKRPDGTYDKMS